MCLVQKCAFNRQCDGGDLPGNLEDGVREAVVVPLLLPLLLVPGNPSAVTAAAGCAKEVCTMSQL